MGKMENLLSNKKIVIIISLLILIFCSIFIYQYVFPSNVPSVAIQQTDNEIQELKDEITMLQERVKNFDKEVKIKTVVIRTEQAKYVESLPPDDIARGIVDELKLFTDRQ